MEHRRTASLSVTDVHHWWTDAVFAACLAWHTDQTINWQCSWRVVWSSLRMCQNIWRDVLVFCQCDIIFLDCFFLEITTSSNFYILQGSAATYWRYGGKCYMGFVGNLVLFPAVKEFWKLLRIDKSYCHKFDVLIFGDTVYNFCYREIQSVK